MRKLFITASLALLSLSLGAQNVIDGYLSRFSDPDTPREAFFEKGGRALGIGGSYRSFNASGDGAGDGYSILSFLNIGQGQFQMWDVAPSFSYFISDNTSIGIRLSYSGYLLDTNLKLDMRDMFSWLSDDIEDLEALNFQISNRHMLHHKGGIALTGRRYMSFFGSKYLGVFAEGRLFGNYGVTVSNPIPDADELMSRMRESTTISVGVKIAGGIAVKLRDNSALTVSIPIIGGAWSQSHQVKTNFTDDGTPKNGGSGTLNQFSIERDIDALGVQIGFVRYILPKKK